MLQEGIRTVLQVLLQPQILAEMDILTHSNCSASLLLRSVEYLGSCKTKHCSPDVAKEGLGFHFDKNGQIQPAPAQGFEGFKV